MKKSLFIIAATALVISCSNNDLKNDIVQEEKPIDFANNYVGKKTKNAGEINSKQALEVDGNTIKVWGWKTYNSTDTKVFNGIQVTYDEDDQTHSSSNWVYSPLKYWDMSASNYKFYAVAPYTSKFAIDDNTRIITCTGVDATQILSDNNGASKVTTSTAEDYLVAEKVDKAPKGNAADDDVSFTFSHILSKLIVKVKTSDNFNNSGNSYPQIKLTSLSVKIQGMCPNYTQNTTGAVSANDKWNGSAAGVTTLSCFVADGTTVTDKLLTNAASEVASYLVAPTATATDQAAAATFTGASAYTASVEYDIYYSSTEGDKEHFVATDKAISTLTSFVQNTSNTLTVTIDPKAIYFDVTSVTDWTNGSDGTLTVE